MPEKLTLFAALKLPVAVVGGVGAIAILLGAFGFGIKTPGARFEEYKVEHVEVHTIINDTLVEIDDHMEEQQTLLEAIVRGECLENEPENLARQGLSTKCRELGIER